jgi:hypothetical protein
MSLRLDNHDYNPNVLKKIVEAMGQLHSATQATFALKLARIEISCSQAQRIAKEIGNELVLFSASPAGAGLASFSVGLESCKKPPVDLHVSGCDQGVALFIRGTDLEKLDGNCSSQQVIVRECTNSTLRQIFLLS